MSRYAESTRNPQAQPVMARTVEMDLAGTPMAVTISTGIKLPAGSITTSYWILNPDNNLVGGAGATLALELNGLAMIPDTVITSIKGANATKASAPFMTPNSGARTVDIVVRGNSITTGTITVGVLYTQA